MGKVCCFIYYLLPMEKPLHLCRCSFFLKATIVGWGSAEGILVTTGVGEKMQKPQKFYIID